MSDMNYAAPGGHVIKVTAHVRTCRNQGVLDIYASQHHVRREHEPSGAHLRQVLFAADNLWRRGDTGHAHSMQGCYGAVNYYSGQSVLYRSSCGGKVAITASVEGEQSD